MYIKINDKLKGHNIFYPQYCFLCMVHMCVSLCFRIVATVSIAFLKKVSNNYLNTAVTHRENKILNKKPP